MKQDTGATGTKDAQQLKQERTEMFPLQLAIWKPPVASMKAIYVLEQSHIQ